MGNPYRYSEVLWDSTATHLIAVWNPRDIDWLRRNIASNRDVIAARAAWHVADELPPMDVFGSFYAVVANRAIFRHGREVDATDPEVELGVLFEILDEYTRVLELLPVVGGVMEFSTADDVDALEGVLVDLEMHFMTMAVGRFSEEERRVREWFRRARWCASTWWDCHNSRFRTNPDDTAPARR